MRRIVMPDKRTNYDLVDTQVDRGYANHAGRALDALANAPSVYKCVLGTGLHHNPYTDRTSGVSVALYPDARYDPAVVGPHFAHVTAVYALDKGRMPSAAVMNERLARANLSRTLSADLGTPPPPPPPPPRPSDEGDSEQPASAPAYLAPHPSDTPCAWTDTGDADNSVAFMEPVPCHLRRRVSTGYLADEFAEEGDGGTDEDVSGMPMILVVRAACPSVSKAMHDLASVTRGNAYSIAGNVNRPDSSSDDDDDDDEGGGEKTHKSMTMWGFMNAGMQWSTARADALRNADSIAALALLACLGGDGATADCLAPNSRDIAQLVGGVRVVAPHACAHWWSGVLADPGEQPDNEVRQRVVAYYNGTLSSTHDNGACMSGWLQSLGVRNGAVWYYRKNTDEGAAGPPTLDYILRAPPLDTNTLALGMFSSAGTTKNTHTPSVAADGTTAWEGVSARMMDVVQASAFSGRYAPLVSTIPTNQDTDVHSQDAAKRAMLQTRMTEGVDHVHYRTVSCVVSDVPAAAETTEFMLTYTNKTAFDVDITFDTLHDMLNAQLRGGREATGAASASELFATMREPAPQSDVVRCTLTRDMLLRLRHSVMSLA